MPSPFPGMDPYLEDPALWPDVHSRLINVAGEMLTAQLRPRYYTQIEDRVYISDDNDPGRTVIIPDLRIRKHSQGNSTPPAKSQGAPTSVIEAVDITHLLDDEIHESYLKVVDRDKNTVVAIIEILSPTNKIRGASGRRDYLRKRKQVPVSPTHLIEIDLLRRGLGVFPKTLVPEHDYLIHVSRAAERRTAKVWPAKLRSPLPTIYIPLRGIDPDASLNLQEVLKTVYDRAAYDVMVDYHKDPAARLRGDDAAWADQLLHSKGLR